MAGRRFTAERKVRLGDVDPSGRLRLDALTRYCQDVSNDDTTDAGLDDVPPWVVRWTVVDELVPAGLADQLTFTTFCSAVGGRWAERRLDVVDGRGRTAYQVATLWVCVDGRTGQPHSLTEQFTLIYQESAAGRKVSARLQNPKLADVDSGETAAAKPDVQWRLRRADFDTWGHVNNAAYWAAVEEWLPPFDDQRRFRMEYGSGLAIKDLGPEPEVTITRRCRHETADEAIWWLDGNGDVAASASWGRVQAP